MVNPKISFWLGIAVSIVVGLGGGTVSLTHIVPDDWIPTVQAWNNLFAFVGTILLTALHGVSSNQSGPLTK